MKNFIYLIGAADSKVAVAVDPSWDAPVIERQLEQDGRKLGAIWLSHHHYDHVGSVSELLQRHDVPVYVQGKEHDFSEDVRFGDAVKKVGPGEELTVGGLSMRCLHTPGHTPGSQCLLAQGALLSGDTVFSDRCGRCDFEGSSPEQMFDSLHKVLKALPDDTVLYPGHDYGSVPVSTLGRERKQNPYFLADTLPKFLARRGG